jgi:hypothetical protein
LPAGVSIINRQSKIVNFRLPFAVDICASSPRFSVPLSKMTL